MTEYFKHPNPYREGTDAYDLFSHMQKIQSYTIRGLIDYCIVKLHLSPTEASQKSIYNEFA